MNNLVDELFDKNKNFQMGIFCTYTLNLDFFENYLLHLSGVTNCSNLCVFTDRSIYNGHFDFNSTTKPKWINRRYLVIPVDTKGVFHPKLYLLASDKAVRIGIGSANLTREGLANNLEIVSVFEITEKDKTYSGFLKECLNFLHEVAIVSHSSSGLESVNKFIDFTSHLLFTDKDSDIHLIHNLVEPIISQVLEMLRGCLVKNIKIISPFYDKKLKVHQTLKDAYPYATLQIYIQQGKSNFPVVNYDFHKDSTSIYLYRDQDSRYVHGKALIFETDKGVYLLSGSTNYTESALLASNFEANVETAVFGEIDSEILKKLCEPKGKSLVLLHDIKQLKTVPAEDIYELDKEIIQDWLIEVLYTNKQLEITLNENKVLNPKQIIINGNENSRIDYCSKINIKDINKSELVYAQIEGYDNNNHIVRSNNVWIVNLDKEREFTGKRRLYITDPSQITPILLDLIENGSEQELIEYLLRFDIPLDLAGFNVKSKAPGAIESQGNVFGDLIQQDITIFKNLEILEATKIFLDKNINKLYAHYSNVQLNKLDNFMLIYGTIFNMMRVFNDYIVKNHKKNPIEAEDWAIMRKYYDMMLHYIEKVLKLLWGANNKKNNSFEKSVNNSIKKDKQYLLGSIYSFEDFIFKRDYENQYKLSLNISQMLIKQVDVYIEKGKIKTKVGTIVKAPLARNGMKDNYIHKRKDILNLVNGLLSDFEKWKR